MPEIQKDFCLFHPKDVYCIGGQRKDSLSCNIQICCVFVVVVCLVETTKPCTWKTDTWKTTEETGNDSSNK